MTRMRIVLALTALFCLLGGLLHAQQPHRQFDAFDYNRRLGQAVNLGNTLEAPNEGDWGFTLQDWHFEAIASGGFDSVRVPIKWSGHADTEAPYTVDSSFFDRIDWVIDEAQRNGLAAIINVHHYDEIHHDIAGHSERLTGLWTQIAERYQDEPISNVYFEIMNEPNGTFSDGRWKTVVAESLTAIRETNPDRMVIVGGINWNSVTGLARLRLPTEDPNLIGTFHYYNPFPFTHQGAEWVDNSDAWLGTKWSSAQEQRDAISKEFDTVERWSERFDRPVFMGEFGAYEKADMESRASWTAAVAAEAEERGFSWGYWEFGAGFGVIDRSTRQWIEPLYDALSPTSLLNLDGLPGLSIGDVTQLLAAIIAESDDRKFDVDGDQQVSAEDLHYWVYFSGHKFGDADLDGNIDFGDYLALSRGFGQDGAGWLNGDFDADGRVGFSDYLLLSANFDANRERAIQSVPEPAGFGWFVLAMVLVSRVRCSTRYRIKRRFL